MAERSEERETRCDLTRKGTLVRIGKKRGDAFNWVGMEDFASREVL